MLNLLSYVDCRNRVSSHGRRIGFSGEAPMSDDDGNEVIVDSAIPAQGTLRVCGAGVAVRTSIRPTGSYAAV